MENMKDEATTLLNQKCVWRAPKSSARKAPRRNWPRLRVIDGVFVVLSDTPQAAASL